MRDYKEKSISVAKARELSEEELKGKIVVGTLVDKDREEFTQKLRDIQRQAMSES